jgi:AcrR family transcriptional regulator
MRTTQPAITAPPSETEGPLESHPAPGGHSVRTRSQHQRRKRIVQAAAALASRGGVEAMQMRTVAERAGVALGTLYRYFPSKMDLVVAVVGEEIDLLESSIERRPPGAATPSSRAVDVLMRATRGSCASRSWPTR